MLPLTATELLSCRKTHSVPNTPATSVAEEADGSRHGGTVVRLFYAFFIFFLALVRGGRFGRGRYARVDRAGRASVPAYRRTTICSKGSPHVPGWRRLVHMKTADVTRTPSVARRRAPPAVPSPPRSRAHPAGHNPQPAPRCRRAWPLTDGRPRRAACPQVLRTGSLLCAAHLPGSSGEAADSTQCTPSRQSEQWPLTARCARPRRRAPNKTRRQTPRSAGCWSLVARACVLTAMQPERTDEHSEFQSRNIRIPYARVIRMADFEPPLATVDEPIARVDERTNRRAFAAALFAPPSPPPPPPGRRDGVEVSTASPLSAGGASAVTEQPRRRLRDPPLGCTSPLRSLAGQLGAADDRERSRARHGAGPEALADVQPDHALLAELAIAKRGARALSRPSELEEQLSLAAATSLPAIHALCLRQPSGDEMHLLCDPADTMGRVREAYAMHNGSSASDIRLYNDEEGSRYPADATTAQSGLQDGDCILVETVKTGGGRSGGKQKASDTDDDRGLDAEMLSFISIDFHHFHGSPVTWDDVHGAEPIRQALSSIVKAHRNPRAYRGAARARCFFFIEGPPGTGKTSAVRAMVSELLELEKPFTVFAPTGADLVTGKGGGDDARRIRALFRIAQAHAPSVIFIDECDSLLHGDSFRIQEMKTVMTELEGRQERDVILVCATNDASRINRAITSRFGDPIRLLLPSSEVRRQIVTTALRDNEHTLDDAGWRHVLEATEGRDGRWLAETLCRGAAVRVADEATERGDEEPRPIQLTDFKAVLEEAGASISSSAAATAPPVAAQSSAPSTAAGSSAAPPPAIGAAASTPAAILSAYRSVIVPRPDGAERGLGVSMADAIAALRDRRPEVLLHVCSSDSAPMVNALSAGMQYPSARAALAQLHSRVYPNKPTWFNYHTSKTSKTSAVTVAIPTPTPFITTGSRTKKWLTAWACYGFMVAAGDSHAPSSPL